MSLTSDLTAIFQDLTGKTAAAKAAEIAAAIESLLVPAGIISQYGGITAPTGYLLCDGSAISRTTYATLYNAITTSKGTCTISNASPAIVTLNGHGLVTGDCIEFTTTGALPASLAVNTNYYVVYINANTFNLATSYANAIAGTKINTSNAGSGTHTLRYCPFGISTVANFLLPDMRGIFPRGAGTHGSLTNANSVAFAGGLGAYQNDKIQGHYHGISDPTHTHATGNHQLGSGSYGYPYSRDTDYGTYYVGYSATGITVVAPSTDTTNGTPRTGTETNPANLGVNFIIKY